MTYNATAPVSPRRSYEYDTLGRPTSRTLARQGATRNDVFTYNDRSELISDVVDGTGLNGWDYDRATAASSSGVASNKKAYANQLNQYTAIEDESHDVFTPIYDDDGNQTRIKTSTGIWNVTYNAKNLAAAASSSGVASRPVLFSKEGENLTVACTYDYMGRRATKVVTENGVITTSHRFLYRGYLQIDSPPPHRRLTPAGQHRSAGCPPGLTAVVVSTIDNETRNVLFMMCKYIHATYSSLKCKKCNKSIRINDCLSRKIAGAEGVIKLNCFQVKFNYRAAHIANGCDFILENEDWDSHVGELKNVSKAVKKRIKQTTKNCVL